MTDKLKMFCEKIKGIKISVIGIGISNTPLIDFLLSKGAYVVARDIKDYNSLLPLSEELEKKGVKLVCGKDYLENIDEKFIFKTPGIRYDLPQLQKAVANGAKLTSEMEVFFELCPAKIFAVTGSDGKTTTTTLIYTMLKKKYENVYIGGNIGKPLLPDIEKITEKDFVVLELSSFQLHTMKQSPEIAVITNVSPNHLNFHTDMNEYYEAKCNIFKYQTLGKLILNYDNAITREISANSNVSSIYFSMKERPRTEKYIYNNKGVICYFDGVTEHEILEISDILLPGLYNVENYMAAIAVVYDYVDKDIINETAKTFGGVEHRNEFIREVNGVKYYNSSIDSSPTRTMAALTLFPQRLILICGGYDKNIPFSPLAQPICDKVKKLILTGATAKKIKEAVISCPKYDKNNLEIIEEDDFTNAVLRACNIAENGDIVILSPACSSFDAFPNFEIRGNTFKNIINNI